MGWPHAATNRDGFDQQHRFPIQKGEGVYRP
jgi:hypothetical protein